MGKNFNLLAVLSLYLIGTGAAHALSCKSGDSSCSDQSVADCTALGYSTADVSNCKHYLYCPLNINYKTCVAFSEEEPTPPESDCPKGYAEDVKDCGIQGDNGWMLRPRSFLEHYNKCRECYKRPCLKGKTEITSQSDCQDGATYSATGYYSGDEPCGKCTAATCPDGYAQNVKDCGVQGSNGWTLGTKDSNGCGKCTGKSCTAGTTERCGAGYTETDTGYYSGDKKCYQCTVTTCPDGYAKDVSGCGTQGANGWTLGTKDTNGCGKCNEKSCTAGTTERCGAGYTETDTSYYSGDKKCYQCTVVTCHDGYAKDVSGCGIQGGWTLGTKDANGCGKCNEKDCPTGTSTNPNCSAGYKQTETGDISGNNKCYECVSVCSSGYTYGLTVNQCGTTGSQGWKIIADANGCGKCKEKSCADHEYDVSTPTSGTGLLCKTGQEYIGDTLKTCKSCITCEDSKKTNSQEGLPYTSTLSCDKICQQTTHGEYIPYYGYLVTINHNEFTGECYSWVSTPNDDSDKNVCCCGSGNSESDLRWCGIK